MFLFKYNHSEMEIASYISLKKEIAGCTGQLKNNFIQAIASKDNKSSAKYIRKRVLNITSNFFNGFTRDYF